MEQYRVSSTLQEGEREYLIQTVNDATGGAVSTTVFVNGVRTETVSCPHPATIDPQKVLTLVKLTHNEKKREIELLLSAYRKVFESSEPRLMFQSGTAFLYRGFFSEAYSLFKAVRKIQPDNHQSDYYLSQVAIELGRFDEAVEAASNAVNYRPGFADYRNALGEAHLAANDWASAITEFETATSVNLYYSDAYYNLGLALLLAVTHQKDPSSMTGHLSRIVDCLNKAAVVDETYKSELLNKGITAVRDMDFNSALVFLQRLRDSKKEQHRKDFSTFYMKFVLHPDWVSDQVIDERITYLEEEIRKNPNYVDLMAELAQCYLEQGRQNWHKGIEQYERTLEVNSSLKSVRLALDQARKTLEEMHKSLATISSHEVS